MGLRYTGGGHGGFLPGVPARDLTDAEVEALGGEAVLVKTGLYAPFEAKRATPTPANKRAVGSTENKAAETAGEG